MRKIIQWSGAVGAAVALAGCSLLGAGGTAKAPSTGPPVVLTQDTRPSALLAVLNGPGPGAALSDLVNVTARPREEFAVLLPGAPPETVLSSSSPAPPTVTVEGMPLAPSSGETSYLEAQYAGRLKQWRGEVAAGRLAEAAKAREGLSAWLSGLRLQAKIGKLADPPGPTGSLAAESATAASALAGLEEGNGNVFGGRRVIVLYTDDLASRPPSGELAGDTVLVVTRYLPTAGAASAAQADLLAAGAAQAAVIGPEVTSAQFAALVSAGLGQGGAHDYVSAPVLFANNSAALNPGTVAQLTALLPRLRDAGATGVINGFASTTGKALANYTLSYDRAAMVASFFEARGIPATSLIIVGHGASDLVAAGSSGLNRRVTVVIEKPS